MAISCMTSKWLPPSRPYTVQKYIQKSCSPYFAELAERPPRSISLSIHRQAQYTSMHRQAQRTGIHRQVLDRQSRQVAVAYNNPNLKTLETIQECRGTVTYPLIYGTTFEFEKSTEQVLAAVKAGANCRDDDQILALPQGEKPVWEIGVRTLRGIADKSGA
ncbi:uncharacterized protein CC84DRAFT_222389 [Paraphaeosphaeria sporulosa]|uniref:Uncharacterized protein n=1 Tax=Paraphaeosphaeria sporulosa TaxID=1460663 RepID=A0A177C3S3_9PLEO|nr:uncharacterized protein CC84DRAFT_222389 [Paraphaeosphaeria sporulosa]OAG01811.1 hypothetical protein CC84DRAFT_222389 [Paraphaeosphaeria sporulosa]